MSWAAPGGWLPLDHDWVAWTLILLVLGELEKGPFWGTVDTTCGNLRLRQHGAFLSPLLRSQELLSQQSQNLTSSCLPSLSQWADVSLAHFPLVPRQRRGPSTTLITQTIVDAYDSFLLSRGFQRHWIREEESWPRKCRAGCQRAA